MKMMYSQINDIAQKKATSTATSVLDSSSQSESLQRKADMANNATQRAEAPRPNNTGMPDNLKAGIESLSGFSMDDVRVHYNSSKPATVQALAYTQGTDIHVAPGQEKCLPHEAWHVAQQMAGRVSPTTNINGMPVNDNAALEHEADVMGEKASMQGFTNVDILENMQNLSLVQQKKQSNKIVQCLTDSQKRKISSYVITNKFKDDHIVEDGKASNASVRKLGIERGGVPKGRKGRTFKEDGTIPANSMLVAPPEGKDSLCEQIRKKALEAIKNDSQGNFAKATIYGRKAQIDCYITLPGCQLRTVDFKTGEKTVIKNPSLIIDGDWVKDTAEGYHYEDKSEWPGKANVDYLGDIKKTILNVLDVREYKNFNQIKINLCYDYDDVEISNALKELLRSQTIEFKKNVGYRRLK